MPALQKKLADQNILRLKSMLQRQDIILIIILYWRIRKYYIYKIL